MNTPVLILAGGLGTRLRSAVPELPKCMAPIHDKPFIGYVIENLLQQGVKQFIFSLGYKHEYFLDYLSNVLDKSSYQVIIEEEPLGTGGAIQLACQNTNAKQLIVTNGDTLFKIGVEGLVEFHQIKKAACTLSLKPMRDFDRYGVVEINPQQLITSFKEKQYYTAGMINGGVYVLDVEQFLQKKLPQKFSFEKDYLEIFTNDKSFYAWVEDEYFIDIGIPSDYQKAITDLRLPE